MAAAGADRLQADAVGPGPESATQRCYQVENSETPRAVAAGADSSLFSNQSIKAQRPKGHTTQSWSRRMGGGTVSTEEHMKCRDHSVWSAVDSMKME